MIVRRTIMEAKRTHENMRHLVNKRMGYNNSVLDSMSKFYFKNEK